MNELTRLIRNDCKPSLGVTEPGAIALAVAAAKKRTRGTVREIHLALNSGMYKNAFYLRHSGHAGGRLFMGQRRWAQSLGRRRRNLRHWKISTRLPYRRRRRFWTQAR